MQKLFHILLGLCLLVYAIGSLVFVFGQAICLIVGMPEMITTIETTADAFAFPAMSIVGALAWIYSLIWKKKGKKSES